LLDYFRWYCFSLLRHAIAPCRALFRLLRLYDADISLILHYWWRFSFLHYCCFAPFSSPFIDADAIFAATLFRFSSLSFFLSFSSFFLRYYCFSAAFHFWLLPSCHWLLLTIRRHWSPAFAAIDDDAFSMLKLDSSYYADDCRFFAFDMMLSIISTDFRIFSYAAIRLIFRLPLSFDYISISAADISLIAIDDAIIMRDDTNDIFAIIREMPAFFDCHADFFRFLFAISDYCTDAIAMLILALYWLPPLMLMLSDVSSAASLFWLAFLFIIFIWCFSFDNWLTLIIALWFEAVIDIWLYFLSFSLLRWRLRFRCRWCRLFSDVFFIFAFFLSIFLDISSPRFHLF